MEFISELWQFLWARKKLWLATIIVIMASFVGLLVAAQGTAVAPFVYTLF